MESYLYIARSSLEDNNKGKVSDDDKERARALIKKAEEWLKANTRAGAREVSQAQKDAEAFCAIFRQDLWRRAAALGRC